jgi:MFS family permease
MATRLLMRLGARLLGPVLPLFVEAIAAPGTPIASTTGVISSVSSFAGAVGALGLGRLGDRIGYRPVLVTCALVSAACYAPQAFVRDPQWLLPFQLGTGLAMGGILAAVSASLAQAAPAGQEGIVYGLDATVVSIANGVGPMLGSALAAWLGLQPPFWVASGIFGLAGLAAMRLLPHRHSRTNVSNIAASPPPSNAMKRRPVVASGVCPAGSVANIHVSPAKPITC